MLSRSACLRAQATRAICLWLIQRCSTLESCCSPLQHRRNTKLATNQTQSPRMSCFRGSMSCAMGHPNLVPCVSCHWLVSARLCTTCAFVSASSPTVLSLLAKTHSASAFDHSTTWPKMPSASTRRTVRRSPPTVRTMLASHCASPSTHVHAPRHACTLLDVGLVASCILRLRLRS